MQRQLATLLVVAAAALLVTPWGWFALPSPHAAYAEELRARPGGPGQLGERWLSAAERAREQPFTIPRRRYYESGRLPAGEPRAHAFRFRLRPGERTRLALRRRDDGGRLFAQLYERRGEGWDYRRSLPLDTRRGLELDTPGTYLLFLQPELGSAAEYALLYALGGTLTFPVAGVGRESVQSFFGDPRDGGRRRHKGVDVFAQRGTIVRAVATGQVSVGRNRLGGRVVRLYGRSGDRYYYAHLAAVDVFDGQWVEAGEAIARVGNSGNARTTPPHLHFGVYRGGRRAVDPMPFLQPPPTLPLDAPASAPATTVHRVTASRLNLRAAPGTDAAIQATLPRDTRLVVQARSGDWLRVRRADGGYGFVARRWADPAAPGAMSSVAGSATTDGS